MVGGVEKEGRLKTHHASMWCVAGGMCYVKGPQVVCKHAYLFMHAPYKVYTLPREEITLKRLIVSHMGPPDCTSWRDINAQVCMFVCYCMYTREE